MKSFTREQAITSLTAATGNVAGSIGLVLLTWLLLTPIMPVLSDLLVLFGWMGLWYYPALTLHELAHFGVAKAIGFKLRGLIVGPLLFRRADNGWTLGVTLLYPLGGSTLAYPRDGVRLVARMRAMVIAGPLANLMTAALAYAALVTQPTLHQHVAGPAIAGFFLTSLFLGYSSSVPRGKGWSFTLEHSDGEALARLFGPTAEEWAARFSVLLALGSGVPPRAWPESWIASSGTADSGDLAADFMTASNVYYAWVDRGRPSEATSAYHDLRRLLPQLPQSTHVLIAYELAFFQAQHLRQFDQAKELLAHAESERNNVQGLPDLGTRDRALAALAIAEGKHAEALDLIKSGLRKVEHASRSYPNGALTFESTVLERMRESLQGVTAVR